MIGAVVGVICSGILMCRTLLRWGHENACRNLRIRRCFQCGQELDYNWGEPSWSRPCLRCAPDLTAFLAPYGWKAAGREKDYDKCFKCDGCDQESDLMALFTDRFHAYYDCIGCKTIMARSRAYPEAKQMIIRDLQTTRANLRARSFEPAIREQEDVVYESIDVPKDLVSLVGSYLPTLGEEAERVAQWRGRRGDGNAVHAHIANIRAHEEARTVTLPNDECEWVLASWVVDTMRSNRGDNYWPT